MQRLRLPQPAASAHTAERPSPPALALASLDAVTLDAFGTLVVLRDPVPALAGALAARGASAPDEEIRRAFAIEGDYYRAHAHEGSDEQALAALRADCARVFLDALGADLDERDFASDYVAALEFDLIPGVREAVHALSSRGLALAVASNWDFELDLHLRTLGIRHLFAALVTSAEAGIPKPDPAMFEIALERLGTAPGRTLHIGDSREDELAARAAGLHFLPAPVETAIAAWI